MGRHAKLSLLVTLWPAIAAADVTRFTARFSYDRPPGERCPNDERMQEAIVRGLGYDPFQPGAPLRLQLAIRVPREAPASLTAEITLTDDSGRLLGQQTIKDVSGDCRTLASAAALAAQLVLEPEGFPKSARPAPPPPALPEPAPIPPPAVAEAAPAPPVQRAEPVEWVLGIGPLLALGASVQPNAGGVASGEVRWRHVALGLELRIDAPAAQGLPLGASEQTWLGGGGLVPCYRLAGFAGCGVLFLGGEQARGFGLASPSTLNTFYAAVGARAEYEWWFQPRFGLAVSADLLVPFARTQTSISGQAEWSTPPVSGVFSVSARTHVF